MTEPLSPLEQKVYHYLIDFLAENTYQPSIRDIARKFRIKSTKTVSDLLHALAVKGYIQRDRARSRGVKLLGIGGLSRVQPVPYYGKIHAGEPSLLPDGSTATSSGTSTAAAAKDDPFGVTGWIITLVVFLIIVGAFVVGHQRKKAAN